MHNSYLLIWAETGYLGIITFVILILGAIGTAFATAFKMRRQADSQILIGLGCGLAAMSIHGFFEWQYLVYTTQYLFAGCLGLIAGLRLRFTEPSAAKVQRRRPTASAFEPVAAQPSRATGALP